MSRLFILFSVCLLVSCSGVYKQVSPSIKSKTVESLSKVTPERKKELEASIKNLPASQREEMAFLIAYMSKADLDTLPAELLTSNVKLAYKARETFPWAKEVPLPVFYNEVLPYASMDETREDWRPAFYDMLYPLVKDLTDIHQAVDTINKSLRGLVKVEYNTKRKKPNQSPSESMKISMASCSGLSILLTDAFRAAGIPSRVAGTPLWVSKEGNHNWSEVYIDGQWYFTEYYPDALNKGWFLDRAGKADKSNPIHWIYATSYKHDGLAFPMVWARRDSTVGGVDVTDRYIELYQKQLVEKAKGIAVTIRMYKAEQCTLDSDGRVAETITIKNTKGDTVASGKTAGPTDDMNLYLTVTLPEPGEYTIEYTTAKGLRKDVVEIKEPKEIRLYFN